MSNEQKLIEKHRATVAAIRAEIAAIDSDRIPRPRGEALAAIDQALEARRVRAAAIARDVVICAVLPGDRSADQQLAPTENLLALLAADALESLRPLLYAEVDLLYTELPAAPMTDAEKRAKLRDLRERLHAAEVAEFAAVDAARAAGLDIEQRGDISPRVLLGLSFEHAI